MPASVSTVVSDKPTRRALLFAGALLVLATLVGYHNSFGLPFIFDDRLAVVENPSIRQLWPLGEVLAPPHNGGGTAGRPLVNLSLAVNFALSGDAVWSYHVLNLAIHMGAGLALFGLVRRTLLQPVLPERLRAVALPLGFAVAALWLLHPLQTESVTCIVQRTESLMGLFYLLTFYCFIRCATSARPGIWQGLSFVFCLLGMTSKEVMVTAPVLVLAYDRTFVGGSISAAWRQRWRYYLALGCTWLLLAALLFQSGGGRGEGAGFGLGVSPWNYLLTQARAIALYLKLSVWPYPLVLDYGTGLARDWREVLPQGLMVLLLGIGVVWAWLRRPAIGFLGVAFFVILAPSSSVVPLVGQTIAEHRMYLPLAAIITLLVVGCHRLFGGVSWWLMGAIAVGLCALTVERNRDYCSEFGIWEDVVRKYPGNARGQFNFANELAKLPGRVTEAISHYEEALRLKPDYPEVYFNLANQLVKLPGRSGEAIACLETAVRYSPGYAEAHNNLAVQLARIPGRRADAINHYEIALQSRPDYAEAHSNLGTALVTVPGRMSEAITHYETALKLRPDYADAHNNLAAALATLPERTEDAIKHYEMAIRLQPDFAEPHNNLALLLAKLPVRLPDAIEHYETALRLRPDFAEAHCNLGTALTTLPGRLPEAIKHYQAAVRIDPGYLLARTNLARALTNSGRLDEAAVELEAVLALDPSRQDIRRWLSSIRDRMIY